jgi:hypothetical protein
MPACEEDTERGLACATDEVILVRRRRHIEADAEKCERVSVRLVMTRSWLRRAGEAAALALTHLIPTRPPGWRHSAGCGISLLQLHLQAGALKPSPLKDSHKCVHSLLQSHSLTASFLAYCCSCTNSFCLPNDSILTLSQNLLAAVCWKEMWMAGYIAILSCLQDQMKWKSITLD